jgi:hypothetical protein
MKWAWTALARAVYLSVGLNTAVGAVESNCPTAAEITPQMLVGRWHIDWRDGARVRGQAPWTLTLAPHPDYEGSLKGQLRQAEVQHLVVADWDDELLTMEESADGQRIDATWQASATEGQCGRELQGLRFTGPQPGPDARRFRMRLNNPTGSNGLR